MKGEANSYIFDKVGNSINGCVVPVGDNCQFLATGGTAWEEVKGLTMQTEHVGHSGELDLLVMRVNCHFFTIGWHSKFVF
jgi:hypothetical protein